MHFISAPWRSSGKTMLSIGLARQARRMGLAVQTFKKGPDFIDPLWLTAASGRPCYNLDPWMQPDGEWRETFRRFAPAPIDTLTGASACVLVEGTMGLHDGLADDGSDSNAAVARALGLPVLLVVDCHGMHRTVAALLQGIERFDPELRFSGVILNRIRSDRHAGKLRRAIEQHSDLPLLGQLPETPGVQILEKELGLVPAAEMDEADTLIDAMADLVDTHCDLERLLPGTAALSNSTPADVEAGGHGPGGPVVVTASRHAAGHGAVEQQPVGDGRPESAATATPVLRIGIARDAAFHFYYADDLATLRERGATIVEVSPLTDSVFPADLDALVIGGGFPERFAGALSANTRFRNGLRAAIEAGLAVHAECAGLMYLCRTLVVDGQSYSMVGVIDGDVTMQARPLGRGYMRLQHVDAGDGGAMLPAHEFHHSRVNFRSPPAFAYRVARGHGVDGYNDGVRVHNVVAGYAHFRHTRHTPWIDWLLARIPARTPQSRVS